MRKVWDKLDEVLGAAMLTAICLTAVVLGYDTGLAQASVAGIVALLVGKQAMNRKENA